ncbi:hypothetical protein ISS85_01680 [Candidatus Microgenomates bacterium]|nr:hypothetical protein [Candidatus Microgenomates bacterium]
MKETLPLTQEEIDKMPSIAFERGIDLAYVLDHDQLEEIVEDIDATRAAAEQWSASRP